MYIFLDAYFTKYKSSISGNDKEKTWAKVKSIANRYCRDTEDKLLGRKQRIPKSKSKTTNVLEEGDEEGNEEDLDDNEEDLDDNEEDLEDNEDD
jgi:hypothetical protein